MCRLYVVRSALYGLTNSRRMGTIADKWSLLLCSDIE